MEFRRLFLNKRFLGLILLLLGINAALFVKTQRDNDYGMDLSLATSEATFDFTGEMVISGIQSDAKSCYEAYRTLLTEYKEKNPEQAAAELTAMEEGLAALSDPDAEELAEYVAVQTLLADFEYLEEYQDYLKIVQSNKESALSLSVFQDSDSFSYRNILRTAAEFEKMESVEISVDLNQAFESVVNYAVTDYLLPILMLFLVFSFLQERRDGLWSMVYASRNGRLCLGVCRIGILAFLSVVGTILFYGSNMLLAGAVYGGFGDWGRAVQSSELFEKLPVCLTVAEFFVWYFVIRMVTLFLLGLLFWLLLLAVSEVKYAVAGLAIFCGAEYLLFAYLPVQSVLNILKYFNIFTYVRISELYTNYLNINLFGYPFGIRILSLCAVIPLTAGAIFGILYVTCRKRPMAAVLSLACGPARLKPCNAYIKVAYPQACYANRSAPYGLNSLRSMPIGRTFIVWAGEFLQSALDAVRSRLSLFGFECYKTLVFQRAMVLLILTALVASNLSYITPVRAQSQVESAAQSYFKELEGPIGESLTARIGEIQAEIDTAVTEYEAAEESYRNGEMDYAQYDVYQMQYETAQIRQEALDIVTERVAELEALQSNTGKNLWLLNEAPYESLWGEDNRSNRTLGLLASLLMLALMSGGMAAFEKKSRMRAVICSTPRGRGKLWKRKASVAGLLTVIVWEIHVTFEMKAFWGRYATDILELEEGTGLAAGIRLLAQNYARTGLVAPIQSLESFAQFPLNVSVGGYYVMTAVLGLLALFIYCAGVMVLADRVSNH